MEHSSLDALAERIARIGRRDSATAMPAQAVPEQLNRMTGLVDQAVQRMSEELIALEKRNADAVTRSELRAAKALDSVAVWLEKRDSRDVLLERRMDERDTSMTRSIGMLASKLEEIDARLAQQPGQTAAPLRQTVQDIEQRLDRVSRVSPQNDTETRAVLDALHEMDRRLQDITSRLDKEAQQPKRVLCDQRDTLSRLEGQLADVLGAVRGTSARNPAPTASAPLERNMAAAIGDIAARQRKLDDDVRQIAPDVLDRTERALGEIKNEIGSLANRFSDPQGSVASRNAVRAEIAAISHALNDLAPRKDVQNVERAVRELAGKGDLRGEIAAISTALHDLAPRKQVQNVERSLRDLASKDLASKTDIRTEIAAISHALEDLAPRRQVQNVEFALRDLASKVEASRNEGTREALLAPIERLLSDIRLNLEGFRDNEALDQINDRLAALQNQFEANQRNGNDPRAMDALTRQLADIRRMLDNDNGSRALSAIEGRLAEIGSRLDDVVERSPSRERDPDIATAIQEVRRLLDRADPARAIAEVEAKLSAQMSEHSRAMEARFVAREAQNGGSGKVSALVEGLAARLDQIQGALERQTDPQEDFDRIVRHVAMLEEKIDTLPDRQADTSGLAEMMRHLAGKVEAIESRMPDVIGLADIVHRLADQVDTALAGTGAGAQNTAALEQQIAAIALRLERPMEGATAVTALEKAVGELFSQIETLKISSTQAAASAAREAVQAALSDLTPAQFLAAANEGVAALAEDIQALREQQGDADRRNQETLASVHDTLGKIVDRLAMLENDIAEALPQAFAREAMPVTPSLSMASEAPARFSATAASTPVVDNLGLPIEPDMPEPSPFGTPSEPVADSTAMPAPEIFIEPATIRNPRPMASDATLPPPLPPLPPAVPQPEVKATSLVASMRQMLARSTGATETPSTPEPPRFEPRIEPTPLNSDLDRLEQDLPIEPGTGAPQRRIVDELLNEPIMPPKPAARGESAHHDFLKLARQVMSSNTASSQAAQAAPEATDKEATKAAKGKRTERVSAVELPGSPKSSSNRKVVPLLGAAAVVAAAGIGGAMWLRMPGGETQMLQTNSIGASGQGDIAPIDQALPPARIEPLSALQNFATDALAKLQPGENVPVALTPEGAAPDLAAADSGTPKAAATTARRIETTGSTPQPKAKDAAAPGIGSIDPNLFAQWPTGKTIDTADIVALKKRIVAMAESGDPAAQYDLAVRLAEGRDMERNPKEALKWFEKAANKGLAPAQFRIGSMYREGKGVAANNAKALDWFKRAAQRGNARAMHNLAVVLAEGVNGAPDYAAAGDWFRKAAEYGIKDSQFNVAILYARGLGLPQDLGEAYKWFDAAAMQGDPDAGKKRDEVATRMDARRLTLAQSEAKAFKAKPLDPAANDVIVPSYAAPAAAEAGEKAGKV